MYENMGLNIIDPLMYVAVIQRDRKGKIRKLTILYDGETIKVQDGMEFLTFTTTVALETWEKK